MFTRFRNFLFEDRHPLWQWWFFLYVIILWRNFLESTLEHRQKLGFSLQVEKSIVHFFIHYPAFYLFLFIMIAWYLKKVCNISITVAYKLVISFSIWICCVPLLDYLFSGGKGYYLGYFIKWEDVYQALSHWLLFTRYSANMSPGMKIEITIACIGLSVIVYLFTKSYIKTILTPLVIMMLGIVAGSVPLLWATITRLPFAQSMEGNLFHVGTSKACALLFLLSLFALVGVIHRSEIFKIFKDFKRKQIIHAGSITFFIAMIIGYSLIHGLQIKAQDNPYVNVSYSVADYLVIVSLFITLLLFFTFVSLIDSDELASTKVFTTYLLVLVLSIGFALSYHVFLVFGLMILTVFCKYMFIRSKLPDVLSFLVFSLLMVLWYFSVYTLYFSGKMHFYVSHTIVIIIVVGGVVLQLVLKKLASIIVDKYYRKE